MAAHHGPLALRTFDKARKLVATAKSLGDTPEAKSFLTKADDLLRPYAMTHRDVEAPPAFTKSKDFVRAPSRWADMGKAQGWKHIDPSTEAYQRKRDEDSE